MGQTGINNVNFLSSCHSEDIVHLQCLSRKDKNKTLFSGHHAILDEIHQSVHPGLVLFTRPVPAVANLIVSYWLFAAATSAE